MEEYLQWAVTQGIITSEQAELLKPLKVTNYKNLIAQIKTIIK